jgi:four helix bundle suffix protein
MPRPVSPSVELLIPAHGGYRRLKSFQVARLCYDDTVRFCDRYIEKRSRTHDQMVQAARSGVQNIAEGSQASGTSKKTELKLTSVARASLEELRLDYEDFLRQRDLPLWPADDPRRKSLVARRCSTAEEVAEWVREQHAGAEEEREGEANRRDGRDGAGEETSGGWRSRGSMSSKSIPSISAPSSCPTYPEIAANAALVLIGVACSLLDRQVRAQAEAFAKEGGFTERLYRVRRESRRHGGR